MKIEIKKPRQDELEKKGVFNWPLWEKEISSFPWHYDAKEQCYLLEGQDEISYHVPAYFAHHCRKHTSIQIGQREA